MKINEDMILAIPIMFLIMILVVLMKYLDENYFRNTIEKIFENRKFKILLSAIILIIVIFLFDGQHKGLIFII